MSRSTARLLAALEPNPDEPTDADLLARFAAHRDAGAFERLTPTARQERAPGRPHEIGNLGSVGK